MAPALNKNSPYKKFFKVAVEKLYENGQFDIYKQRYTNTKTFCKSARRKGEPLGLFRLSSLFMMLSLGIILSCLILICEFVNQSNKSCENKCLKILNKEHCTGCNENKSARYFCENCMEALCCICYEAHRRVKLTRNHIIRGLDK